MDRRRKHDRKKSAEGAELGELPAIVNPARRRACGLDLHLFLATYFPDSTGATLFSDDHDRVIQRIQACIERGGRFVNAVYRGFAKTTITELAALWALIYGFRQFALVLGSDKAGAKGMVASITSELCENDLLAEDFPEVCLPFRALDGRPQRAASQTHRGNLTHLEMKGDTLVLPTIWREDGTRTPASGGIIRSRGLLSAVRGIKYKRADGRNARPDLAIGDDIQTDTSAKRPAQVEKRLEILRKGVLKSAGHRKTIACVINATVIADEDAIDQLLDPERNPAWDGERIKMVRRWADTHETDWQQYAQLRRQYDRLIPGSQQRAAVRATSYYRERQERMDAGAEVSWFHCFDPEQELSAIQHAYNLWIDDPPEVFESECQNQPARVQAPGLDPLDPLTLSRRFSDYPREEVPAEADRITAFIDVHDDVLYWGVAAWEQGFSGWVIDYGTWPDQRRAYFTKRQATRTLRRKYPGRGPEGAVQAGLEELTEQLCGREWKRADGTPLRIARLLIDTGWRPAEVHKVCRKSPHAAILLPSRGVGIRAGDAPISDYKARKGRTLGHLAQWYIEAPSARELRVCRYDTNHWKTWLHGRLACALQTPGALTLCGSKQEPEDHRLLADHLVGSESALEVTARGRTILEWKPIPGRDNHWLDVLVGCSVAASLSGCSLDGERAPAALGRSRRSRAIAAAQRKGLS